MSGVASPSLSDAQADQVLELVRQQIQLVLTSPNHIQPGQPLTAALVPPDPVIDVSDLANGVLNLAWAAKDVIFANAKPVELPTPASATTPDALDGDELLQSPAVGDLLSQPFPPPLPGGTPFPPLPAGQTTLVKTPGVSAQLFGTFSPPQLKVGVSVYWEVRDQAGEKLDEGPDFIATQGLTSANVSLVLPPVFRELRLDTLLNPGGTVVCLSACVTLRLGAQTKKFTTDPVPILLLPLLIPTVVVLFSEPNFGLTHDSAALVLVPRHSPLASSESLFKTLRKIEAVTDALRSIGGLASFFLGLGELLSAVPEQPRLRFASRDEIRELESIKIKKRPWYDFLGDDPDFDDKVESLMVFGLPGTRVQFFNDIAFKELPDEQEGHFDIGLKSGAPNVDSIESSVSLSKLITSDCFVSVRTLDSSNDRKPVTFPAGRCPDFLQDLTGDPSWRANMSSVRFHKDWLVATTDHIKSPLKEPPLACDKVKDLACSEKVKPPAVKKKPTNPRTRPRAGGKKP